MASGPAFEGLHTGFSRGNSQDRTANNQIVELTGLVEIRITGSFTSTRRLAQLLPEPYGMDVLEPIKGPGGRSEGLGEGCEAIETRILPSLRVPARSWRTTS